MSKVNIKEVHLKQREENKITENMCSMSVLCPLCAQTSFTSIDALRNSLIKAANGPLACPICSELFLGLDKLTIHLFSHTNMMTHTTAINADVPKILNGTKATTKPSKSPVHGQAICGETMAKKIVDDNSVTEKKTKRCKQTKVINKCKYSQQEDTDLLLKTSQNQLIPTSTSQQVPTVGEGSQLSVCDICEFTFRNEQLRDMHFRLVHQNSPQQTTMLSNTGPLTEDDNTRTVTTTGPDFKCHLCAKVFKMKGSLRVHLKVVHMIGISYGNNPPKLGICDRIRYKEGKNHQNTKINTTKSVPSIIQQQIVTPTTKFQQPINANATAFINSPHTTEVQLSALTLLSSTQPIGTISTENHTPAVPNPGQNLLKLNPNGDLSPLTDTSLLGSNVLLVFAPQNSEISKDTFNKTADNPKIWECDVCSKSFTTKYFLKKHKRLHTGEMPYSCEICARTFTFQQSYHKHLLYHSDEKPHICAVCGRAFKELSTLHNHERIHSGEKPFKCEICGKCFRQRVSFLVHTRIHTGVMPYKCEKCEKSFRYKVSLRTHKCLQSNSQPDTTITNTPLEILPTNNITESTNDHLTENFIKAFLESTNETQHSPASLEIASITDQTCLEAEKLDPKSVEALLSKSVDDIVVESCNKMGIGNAENFISNKSISKMPNLSPPTLSSNNYGVQNFSDGSSSPLQKLQYMRLYSPKLDMQPPAADQSIDFPQFLFENGGQ